jgi:hypothetical protein
VGAEAPTLLGYRETMAPGAACGSGATDCSVDIGLLTVNPSAELILAQISHGNDVVTKEQIAIVV